MKTYEDFLKSPEPRALREAHAMRLKVQEETKNMTATEKTAYYHHQADAIFEAVRNDK
jgi:hypothetical protein